MKEPKFMICKHCGNIIGMIHDAGVTPICCGEPMHEIKANTEEAATEKHIPVLKVEGNTVTATVGSVLHPMLEGHHIAWVYLLTEQGGQRKPLPVDGKPEVTFALCEGDKAICAYAYCNLHGLWKAEV